MQQEQEEELPKNVQLRDFDDFNMLRGQIFNGVKNSLTSAFPVNYGNVRLELHDVDYDELDDVPISQQKKMLLEDKYITKKLRGTIKLFDTTNDQLLEEKRLSLMRVPYLTGRGTFIHGGNEYFSILQSRLLPGVYTRKQENGALETQFNARPGTGVGFRVGFEPETAQYRLKISQANLHMYSLLKDLGTSDEELEQSWGKEILNANRNKYDSRVFDKAYERLVPTRMKKLDKSREDKINSVRKSLDNAQIHARVAHKNLPNMFDAKIASEWNARWEGKQASEKLIEDIPFAPDLTPDEVIDSYISEDDNIKSAADMRALLQARRHSIIAKEEYKKKTAIMVAAMARYPDEFVVDEDGHMSGVTHLSSGFRIHVPKAAIPNRVKRVFEANDSEEENGLYESKTASKVNIKKYYHGTPVKGIEVLREGSYITPDLSIARLMGLYHTDTGKTWSDEDLEEPHYFNSKPKWKKEPKGEPEIYELEVDEEDIDSLDNPYEHKLKKEKYVSMHKAASEAEFNPDLKPEDIQDAYK